MTRAVLVVAVAIVAMGGCEVLYEPDVGNLQPLPPDGNDTDASTVTGVCGDSDPNTAISFATQIRPLLARSPGGCGCHSASTTSGFNLGTYETLRRGGMNSGTRVIVPSRPCESILVQKLGLAPPFGARMPYNGPPYFSADDLRVVRDWIAEGALDN